MRSESGDQKAVPVEPNPRGLAVVLCLGNRYMRDDGVAMRVAEALKGALGGGIVVEECQALDLALLLQYQRASKIIVVDALKSGAPPGSVSRYGIAPRKEALDSLPREHGLKLNDVFDLASATGIVRCPVTIVGVEPKDCGVGEGLTPELEAAIPLVVGEVERALES
jgi:hydrogenase maturation protease